MKEEKKVYASGRTALVVESDNDKESPNQAQMTVKVIVDCTQSDGAPGCFDTVVKCALAEYEAGEHYKIAKARAREAGFEGPFDAFDEHDGPAWLFEKSFPNNQ